MTPPPWRSIPGSSMHWCHDMRSGGGEEEVFKTGSLAGSISGEWINGFNLMGEGAVGNCNPVNELKATGDGRHGDVFGVAVVPSVGLEGRLLDRGGDDGDDGDKSFTGICGATGRWKAAAAWAAWAAAA